MEPSVGARMNDPAASTQTSRATLVGARLVTTLHTAILFGQPITAGLFLSGHGGALDVHNIDAGVITSFVGWIQIVAVVPLARRLGQRAPIVVATLLWLAEFVQHATGNTATLVVHIPLGVALVTGASGLLAWAWKPRSAG